MTLDALVHAARQVLSTANTPAARTELADVVAAALQDPEFVRAQFAVPPGERRILYEDADLGFCILAHEFTGPRHSSPHDHGPSWAIYGQAAGETEMTDFALVAPATPDRPAQVRRTRTYVLAPGDVHVYNEGDVHAPSRSAPTRLIRVEGMNLDAVTRAKYEAVGGDAPDGVASRSNSKDNA